MMKNEEYISLFASLGKDDHETENYSLGVNRFVCEMYGRVCKSTNEMRYIVYTRKQGKVDSKSMPPCSDSLEFHLKRAVYQTYIWKNCLQCFNVLPPPDECGWKYEDGALGINWGTLKPAPEDVLKHI